MIIPNSQVPPEASHALSRAKAMMVLKRPFYASILLRRPVTFTDEVPFAGIDQMCRLYVNPMAFTQLSDDQQEFLLAHEVLHVMLNHAARRRERHQMPWNIACDAPVNAILKQAKVGAFIPGGVDMPGAELKTAEEIYDELMANAQSIPTQVGGVGSDLIEGDGSQGTDSPRPLLEEELSAIREMVKVEIAQAHQLSKMRGDLDGNLDRLVQEILEVRTPWYQLLERFMMSVSEQDYSWSRPNRRYMASGIYMPSMARLPSIGEVVILVDTSGSISGDVLKMFCGHFNAIMGQCQPKAIHAVYFDTRLQGVETFTEDDLPIHLKAAGGGGTSMDKGLRYIGENYPDVDCCVLLTDGLTPWPASVDFPLLVLCTTDVVSPVGETVRFEE